jgi:hypothetical protein
LCNFSTIFVKDALILVRCIHVILVKYV